jgi:hypothetical protein
MITCSMCKQEKPESEFRLRKDRRRGFESCCHPCRKEYQRQLYQRNRSARLEKVKQYQRTHKEQRHKYVVEYNITHREQIREYHKRYQQANPTALADRRRKKEFGVSPREYAERLASQNGLCAICGRPSPNKRPLGIDHDHATGKNRSLLCCHCNSLLGFARDDIGVLEKAIAYLRAHR